MGYYLKRESVPEKSILVIFAFALISIIYIGFSTAQEIYIVDTFDGNIETRDDNLSIIEGGEAIAFIPSIPGDTFDGTLLDTKKWRKESWNGATIYQDDRLTISTSGDIATSIGRLTTQYEFLGNFDVQVDFKLGEGWSTPALGHLGGAIMGVVVGDVACHLTRIGHAWGGQQIMLYSFDEGILATIDTTSDMGKYRITRIGESFRFWYDIGSDWNELGSVAISSASARIYLSAGSVDVRHAFTSYFDNFQINHGATNYFDQASMKMVAHVFTSGVFPSLLKIDADLPEDTGIGVKVYGKEKTHPSWSLLGEYQFDAHTKEIDITGPAYVDTVKYGLTGTEGISFTTKNTDSAPILRSITLETHSGQSLPEIVITQPSPNSVEKWDVYELTLINEDVYSNPFWDVLVNGVFSGPGSQTITMEGFYYDAYTWKIRFSPTQEGTWLYTVRFTTAYGTTTSNGNFTCLPCSDGNHGFISINEANPYTFVYGDGLTFIPNGINGHTPAVTAAHLGFTPEPSQVPNMWSYIAGKHLNTYRLHCYHQTMFTPTFPWNTLEGHANLLADSDGLDRYNLADARMIDRWLEQTMPLGINWYMCLMAIHDVPKYPFTASYWSTELGGPFPNLNSVYSTDYPQGLELVKKYIRYVINRYSAYRNIFVWEYNNEWGAGTTVEWVEAIDEVIDQKDPYERPHTVSFWNFDWSRNSPLYDSPAIDITDDHCYPRAGFDEYNVDVLIQDEALYRYGRYEKPVMFGEFGSSESNIAPHWHDYERIGYWAIFAAGGSALIWFSGHNDPEGVTYNRTTVDWLSQFHNIMSCIRDYPAMASRNEIVSVSEPVDLRAYCLAGNGEYLVYVHHYSDHSTVIHGKELSISLPFTTGGFVAEWFDPNTGSSIATSVDIPEGGLATMTIPDFMIDTVVYIRSNEPIVDFSIPLSNGWNLISTPVQLADNSLETALYSISNCYISVWSYDSVEKGWKRHIAGVPDSLNNFEGIEPGEGYWINIIEDDKELRIAGKPIVEPAISLGSGWNLVGYNCLKEQPLDKALLSIAGKYSSVWAYDAVHRDWKKHIPDEIGIPNDLETMEPGRGYWINAKTICIWDVTTGVTAAPIYPIASSKISKHQILSDRPEIPYSIWGAVRIDGIKDSGSLLKYIKPEVLLKVDNDAQANCELGTASRYENFYILDVPTNIGNPSYLELCVRVDGNIVESFPVPTGEPGQVIRLDLPLHFPPKVNMLHQNYPNPFNPDTWIPYQLRDGANVVIEIYAVTGQLVRTLNLGYKPAGFYTEKRKAAYWDGRNGAGEKVASGIYFYSIQAGSYSANRKMTVIQ